jgi:hypothetical protein
MIKHFTEQDVRGMDDLDLWFGGTGYYYSDETSSWIGPYNSYEETETARGTHDEYY